MNPAILFVDDAPDVLRTLRQFFERRGWGSGCGNNRGGGGCSPTTSHPWPGNVRELRNALERAVVLAAGETELGREHFPALDGGASEIPAIGDPVVLPLAEIERQHIERALFLLDGNRTAASKRLGISRATLHAKIKQHRLENVGRGG